MPQRERTRDHFAEQFLAGVFADVGWNLYFPRRDMGFDFIVSKNIGNQVIIRPVQVKGKFPEEDKQDRTAYGWVGELSAVHPDMVLAIPYFDSKIDAANEMIGTAPLCIAFMPRSKINTQSSKGFACQPAKFADGLPMPRKDYQQFFDAQGLRSIEAADWSK